MRRRFNRNVPVKVITRQNRAKITIRCKASHGLFEIGREYTGRVLPGAYGWRVDLDHVPNFTAHPFLSLDENKQPRGEHDWHKFEIV